MGFSAKDFDKIYEYAGKEFLEQEYKEFECIPKCQLGGEVFDLGIKVDLQKFQKAYDIKTKKMTEEEKEKFDEERKEIRAELDKFAKYTAEKLSTFRVKIYSYALEKMLKEVKDKKPGKPLAFHLNEKNIVHMVPLKDNVMLVYGVDFQQPTDQDSPKKYSNGLVVFNLFVNKFDTIKKFLNYFITFREYIQYHIHSIKTFLHIRMNKKGKELMGKLDGCKIIPETYIKHLESVQFYTNWNKKEENQKIFTDEVKKINV